MCQNMFRVKPRNSRHEIFCNCGHCPSCLQSKANKRCGRILAHRPPGYRCFFVHLTYDDRSVPYITYSDFSDFIKKSVHDSCPSALSVYRNGRFSRTFGDVSYISANRSLIASLDFSDCKRSLFDYIFSLSKGLDEVDLPLLPRLVKENHAGRLVYDSERIAVSYYPDVQLYLKRLRNSLFKKYKASVPLSYFATSEYGPTSVRPHFHLLVWLPTFISFDEGRHLLVMAWPFASKRRTLENIEEMVCAASYASEYINCSSSVPDFLRLAFPPRCSHSLNFGFNRLEFTFNFVCHSITENHCCEFLDFIPKKDSPSIPVTRLFPKYVISRYFLELKGFSRIARASLYDIYRDPEKYLSRSEDALFVFTNSGDVAYTRNVFDFDGNPIYYTDKEVEYFINGLRRRFSLYWEKLEPLGLPFHVYAERVVDGLITYHLSFLHFTYRHESNSFKDSLYSFFNAEEFIYTSDSGSDIQFQYFSESFMPPLLDSPSDYPFIRNRDTYLTTRFHSNIKQRKLRPSEILHNC